MNENKACIHNWQQLDQKHLQALFNHFAYTRIKVIISGTGRYREPLRTFCFNTWNHLKLVWTVFSGCLYKDLTVQCEICTSLKEIWRWVKFVLPALNFVSGVCTDFTQHTLTHTDPRKNKHEPPKFKMLIWFITLSVLLFLFATIQILHPS